MSAEQSAIVRKAEQLMFEVAEAVSVFPKRYKYELGSKLSDATVEAAIIAEDFFYAGNDRDRQRVLVDQLSSLIKQVKKRLKVAVKMQCFSKQRYGLLSRIAENLGRQCGGLMKHTKGHPKGQSHVATRRECPVILSTSAACSEAKP